MELILIIFFCLFGFVLSMTNYSSDGYEYVNVINYRDDQCNNSNDCFPTQICDSLNLYCRCPSYTEWDQSKNECVNCPNDREECVSCCRSQYSECLQNICTVCYDESGNQICNVDSPTMFATGSQIAISVAMILGIMILISLLYKVCTRPRFMPGNRNRQITEADLQRNTTARVSVSSIQIRVLARLQNRPPRYETQHNYDQRVNSCNPPVTINPYGEAPPSYSYNEGGRNEVNEPYYEPPSYSVAIVQGIVNEGYSQDQQQQSQQISTNRQSNELTNNTTNIIKPITDTNTSKTLHILHL